MKSGLNGRTFKYHFWEVRFHMINQYYKCSRGLFLNNSPQVFLIGNPSDQVPPFRYIYLEDYVSHLVRGGKVQGDIKYLMRSIKRAK